MRGLALLLALGACRPPPAPVARVPEVRHRPAADAPGALAAQVLPRVPGATWDEGLARATALLTAIARDPYARITPGAAASALAVAGYPGPASFARATTEGGLPEGLLDELAAFALRAQSPVDLALTRRAFADGRALWIAAVAPRRATLDPLPRDLPLDELLPVRVELDGSVDINNLNITLYHAPPAGRVRASELTPALPRFVGGFHEPGEHRLEVVARWAQVGGTERAEVLLLWSHFVEAEARPPERLPVASGEAPDPMAATEALYAALDARRAEAGLPSLARFQPFEPLAREHAALMAGEGVAAHVLPGVSEGVPTLAARRFHPAARHQEDVAVAADGAEALELVWLSPGHRRTLLCEDCTHVAIGAALEPRLDLLPRLFVVWELLAFPNGEPRPVERHLR